MEQEKTLNRSAPVNMASFHIRQPEFWFSSFSLAKIKVTEKRQLQNKNCNLFVLNFFMNLLIIKVYVLIINNSWQQVGFVTIFSMLKLCF